MNIWDWSVWDWLLTGCLVLLVVVILWEVVIPLTKHHRCEHLNTRCIHGDENWDAMRVYTFRFWKSAVMRRQRCLDCGRALDRPAICTVTGEDVHEWHGTWPPGVHYFKYD